MTTNQIDFTSLGPIAATMANLNRQLEIGIDNTLMKMEPPDETEFWGFIEEVNKEIRRFQRLNRGADTIEQAASEWIRSRVVDNHQGPLAEGEAGARQSRDADMAVINKYAQMVRHYQRMSSRLSRKLHGAYEYHGDHFGDVCDSLPLAGPAIFGLVMEGGITSEEQLHGALLQLGLPVKFFLGENYVHTSMVKALVERFTNAADSYQQHLVSLAEEAGVYA